MDEKLKELIALGASAAVHCQPCVDHHLAKAKELGATSEELQAAVAIGHMVDVGASKAMKQYTTEALQKSAGTSACGCAGGCCG